MAENKELTVQERAVVALGLTDLKEKLTELAESSKSLVEITNQDSYQQVHAARMVLKNQRVAIAKTGKAARDDANAFAKALIAEEHKLIGIISAEEDRLQALQTKHDERAERERQAKIQAELKRVEDIQDRVAELRGAVTAVNSMGPPSLEKIEDFITDLEKIIVDESFDEFEGQAHSAKASSLAFLRERLTAAKEQEAEEKRVKAERAELAKLRAAEEKRQAEAEKKRQAEEKKQREELAVQKKNQDAAQKKIDDENARLAKERAVLEREQRQEADRKTAEEKAEQDRKAAAQAAAKKAKYPGERAIVDALTEHFGVPPEVVMAWLTELRKAA